MLRSLLGNLIKDSYSVTPVPVVFWTDEPREMQAFTPIIKVYTLGSWAEMKGFGYQWRKVKHRLTVDIKCRDNSNAEAAKEEVLRILMAHRKQPFDGYNVMEFNYGTQKVGYSGFYWWLVEVTVWQIRKPVGSD